MKSFSIFFVTIISLFAFLLSAQKSTSKSEISTMYPVDLSQSAVKSYPLSSFAKQRKYWPTRAWQQKKLESIKVDKKQFDIFISYVFPQQTIKQQKKRKGIRTNGLVIIKNGYLVYEKYSSPYHKNKPHLLWSVSKSISNALIGIALKEKKLGLNDLAYKYYPVLDKEGGYRDITINHLMQMSSGLYWDEGYESSPLKSSVIAMLYTRGTNNMAQFAASQKIVHKPGTHWYYSSGTTNLLMGILRKCVADEYANYPWQKLFDPLGMTNVTFEKDGAGNFVGSSYIYMTPRDLAKFGFLFLNDGIWENKRILPQNWVQYSTTMASGYILSASNERDFKSNYAAQWYLNQGIESKKIDRPWPDAPKDTFHASGHWGQYLFVIPSRDMVVVRVGDDRDKSFDKNKFLRLLLTSFDK